MRETGLTDARHMETPEGLTTLYRRYAAWLQRRLRERVSAEDAADAVQETYLRLASRSFGEVRHPRALLLTIAMNIVRDDRRRARRAEAFTSALGMDGDPVASAFPEAMLVRMVETMPSGCRDIFVMSRFEGMTYPEIAQASGLSLATVERRMAKALAHCMAHIDG